MLDAKTPPEATVRCEVIQEFQLRGLYFHLGQTPTFRLTTAKLLALAKKIRVMEDVPDAFHTRAH